MKAVFYLYPKYIRLLMSLKKEARNQQNVLLNYSLEQPNQFLTTYLKSPNITLESANHFNGDQSIEGLAIDNIRDQASKDKFILKGFNKYTYHLKSGKITYFDLPISLLRKREKFSHAMEKSSLCFGIQAALLRRLFSIS